jgi:GT2 family glycosyltransferase
VSDRVAGPNIGLVGPMSNYASPPQGVDDVPYRDTREMLAFAQRWRDDHRGQWLTVPKVSGFCLLLKREVYEKIGGLDERFGLGMFDDDDLAERARRAGFEGAVAHDLFVHHFGSRTFLGKGVDAEKLLDENAQRFAAKWGLNGTHGRRVALRRWHVGQAFQPDASVDYALQLDANVGQAFRPDVVTRVATRPDAVVRAEPSDGVSLTSASSIEPESLTHGRPKVSLTMIVKDEENNLPHCLESVRGVFDEIVVVDTGSTDRTIEIARSFGAEVFEFAWIDDFAAARNEALAHATGDYAFWLDADDVVDPPEREKLIALLGSLQGHASREGEATREGEAPTEPPRPATLRAAGTDGPQVHPARTEPRPPGTAG